jgi:FKBP-type peptidyl-prolyl cis-trans isomerase SlyD
MNVAKGNLVRIAVELKVKGGEVIESSARTGPIDYVHGEGRILPGLERRVEGMAVGEQKTGVIPAVEAFGEESDMPQKKLRRTDFPPEQKLAIGSMFEAKSASGQPVSFKVSDIKGDEVTVRLMHPLCGRDLEFSVKVIVIDDPKARRREGVAPPPPPADALGLKPEE